MSEKIDDEEKKRQDSYYASLGRRVEAERKAEADAKDKASARAEESARVQADVIAAIKAHNKAEVAKARTQLKRAAGTGLIAGVIAFYGALAIEVNKDE